jgi:hypothetical protein
VRNGNRLRYRPAETIFGYSKGQTCRCAYPAHTPFTACHFTSKIQSTSACTGAVSRGHFSSADTDWYLLVKCTGQLGYRQVRRAQWRVCDYGVHAPTTAVSPTNEQIGQSIDVTLVRSCRCVNGDADVGDSAAGRCEQEHEAAAVRLSAPVCRAHITNASRKCVVVSMPAFVRYSIRRWCLGSAEHSHYQCIQKVCSCVYCRCSRGTVSADGVYDLDACAVAQVGANG